MFFKMGISPQHASLHMENFSPNKAYDWADCVSTRTWPLLPLIQGNGTTWKTMTFAISGALLMTRYLKGKTHSWLLKADASFGLLTKALSQ